MSAIDREQTLAAFGEWVEGRDEPDRWMIAVAAEIVRALPAIPLDDRRLIDALATLAQQDAEIEGLQRKIDSMTGAWPDDADTELSDIMEYLCEHFDASMDEHEVSRMSAMIREYASNVAKSRGALPVLETTKGES